MQNDLKKDYLWNTLGVFSQNAISPLLLIAITRLNGIGGSGIFSYAFSVAIIFWGLGMWGGRTFQVSDVKREFSQRSYVMVRLILAAFILIGAVLFCFVNRYDTTKTTVIIALVLFKVLESISDAIYGILQVHGHLYISGRSLLYKAVAGFVVFVGFDALTKSLLWASLGVVVVNALVMFFYDLPKTSKLEVISIGRKQIRQYITEAFTIMRRCAPIATVIFLSLFSLNIPRYFVDKYHPAQIGYFGIIAMPITLIALLMAFILQPKVVELSNLYEQKHHAQFRSIVTKLTLVTSMLGVAVWVGAFLVGVPALKLVFGVDFAQYKTALMVIIAGGIVNAMVSILINVLIIMRHFKGQFYTLLSTNILLVITSAILVKREGLLGGVTLFALVNIVQVLALLVTYAQGFSTE